MVELERRRANVRRECEKRGIRVEPVGKAWRLRGPGVDLVVVDLAEVRTVELRGGEVMLQPD